MWGRATAVLVIHDVRRLTAPQTAGRRERGLYGFVIPRAARHAHSILTVSDFSAAEIGRTLGTTASVDVVRRHPAPVSAEPGVSEEGRALVVGAIRSYKGLDTVTEALSRLDGGGVRVTWAGANEQAAAAIRSHPDVELLGWVDDARLDALRRQAWISLNPSRYEGYGLAVAESLAYGLPTVASDIPAHREVAGAAAEYFPPGDPAALAATLRRLRRDPALVADLAGRARERAHWLESRRSSWGEALLTVLELAAERR
jgi:glycosyltransferase involved in cell wall biosynthesis